MVLFVVKIELGSIIVAEEPKIFFLNYADQQWVISDSREDSKTGVKPGGSHRVSSNKNNFI